MNNHHPRNKKMISAHKNIGTMESNVSDLNMELCEEMSNYVEKLTTSGKQTLDEDILKKFKKICKKSDSYVLHAYHLLMVQLCKDHAEIRRSAFQIIDQLFQRSHCFREKLVSEFQTFFELTIEIDPEQPLPPPKAVARNLKVDALKAIQQWNQKFGPGYKKLTLGYNFLKNCKMIDFNDIQARSVVERMREQEKERKKELHLQRKREKITKEIEESKSQIDSCLVEAENCFQLLLPTPDSFFIPEVNTDDDNEPDGTDEDKDNAESLERENSKSSDSEDNDFEDVAEGFSTSDLVKDHGLGSATYNLTIDVNSEVNIKETDDNRDLMNSLKDSYCLICRKYLPTVTRWLQGLSQSGANDILVKQIIDLKTSLTETKTKYGKLKFLKAVKTNPDSDDDDDDFEEVEEKEGYEPEIPAHLRKEYGLDPVASKSASSAGQSVKKPHTEPSRPLVKKFISSDVLKKPVKITPRHWSINADIRPEDVTDPTSMAATVAKWKKELEQNTMEEKPSTSSSQQDCEPSTSSGISHPSTSKLRNQSTGSVKKEIIVGDRKKEEMLKMAPFVPFGPDLASWENPNNVEVPMIIKYDSLHRFWAPKEAECTASEQDIALLKNRSFSFVGEFEPVKWKCRAPMPNGTLCPRMDRIKCPFHGKIIGRDNMGRPTNKEDAERLAKDEAAKNGWQDKELQRDIEAALGIDLGSDRDLCVEKGKGKGKGKRKKKKEEVNLTDIKTPRNSVHDRLQKKLFKASTLKRVNAVLDIMDAKKSKDKFGNQFHYAHSHI
ncbi:UVSSA [Acanthosepion pharaonis]|uniref:UVSSA n=1 Tax=Acanthosepion pharaonis TaxID=158019 RepID=A0A812ECC0_ACAPH|nr:UVSSA [Sepia pharaonis]